jgi:hypothetical protein
MTDGVDDGHAGEHGDPVAGEHEGDAHDENGDEQPQHVIAVVGPQHGSGGDGPRSDDHPGQHDAGADPFQHLQKSQFGNCIRVKAQMFNVHNTFSLSMSATAGSRPTAAGNLGLFGAAACNRLHYFWLFYSIFLLVPSIFSDTSAISCRVGSTI